MAQAVWIFSFVFVAAAIEFDSFQKMKPLQNRNIIYIRWKKKEMRQAYFQQINFNAEICGSSAV